MSKPRRVWTEKDELNRASIVADAAAKGISHIRLAEAIKVNQTKFHRWSKGLAHLSDEEISQLRKYLANGDDAVEPGPGQTFIDPEMPLDDVLDGLKGFEHSVPEEENDSMRYAARKHSNAIVGQAFRLMVGAKSEAVRARMVEFLREIGYGKAVQSTDREIPKPPMEDEELLDQLHRLLANNAPTPGSGNSSGTVDNNAVGTNAKNKHTLN